MNYVPENQHRGVLTFNIAPMIDFLFIMLSFFATLAVSRTSLFDTSLDLVQLQKTKEAKLISSRERMHQINISVSPTGAYKWITEVNDYTMDSPENIQYELLHQYNIGVLPSDKNRTEVLLHIDKQAPWEAIAKVIFSIREMGFEAKPVYFTKE